MIENNADIDLLYHTKKDLATRSTRGALAQLCKFYKVNIRTYDLQCDLVWILALHIIMSHKRKVGKFGSVQELSPSPSPSQQVASLRTVKVTDGARIKQIPLDPYGRLSLASLRVFGSAVVGLQDETTKPPTVIPLKTKKSSSLHQTATTMDQTINITTVNNWRWDFNKTYNVVFDGGRAPNVKNTVVVKSGNNNTKLVSDKTVNAWIAYLLPMLMMLIYIKLHTGYRYINEHVNE